LILESTAQVLCPFIHPPAAAYFDWSGTARVPPLSRGALSALLPNWEHYGHATCATKMEASGLCD
jgi:hypothetical protein